MKRLRKATHAALVWTSVCLLSVDPAAACRLLGNRRCCCCPCPPAACDTAAPSSPAKPAEPSPSDAPPGTTTGGGQLPPAPLAADSPSIEPAHPVAVESDRVPNVVPPNINALAPAIPAAIVPARPQPRVAIETANEPPLPTVTSPRQPANLTSPTAATISPPAPANVSAKPIEPPSAPMPMPPVLKPQQGFEPAVTNVPKATAPGSSHPMPAAAASSEQPLASQRSIEPPMPPTVVVPGHPKSPTQPAIAKPTDPIKSPAFSPVDDDPFAPRPPAAVAPKQPEPADDDPFAPLKPAPAPQSKPAAPIAAEPTTLKIADALIPGADGRLPIRDWSDASGQFRVKARLISIQGGQVRLLKATGRTTTVPTERLSAADRQYVAEVVTRYGNDLTKLDQFAAR